MILPFVKISKVPREALKNMGEARGFQRFLRLRTLINDKIILGRYYCIRKKRSVSACALYFIASSHFSYACTHS